MGGIECEVHILAVGPGDAAKQLAVDGRQVVKIAAIHRGQPSASDEISVDGTKRSVNTGTYFFEECGHLVLVFRNRWCKAVA
jgi:hypothetical protein